MNTRNVWERLNGVRIENGAHDRGEAVWTRFMSLLKKPAVVKLARDTVSIIIFALIFSAVFWIIGNRSTGNKEDLLGSAPALSTSSDSSGNKDCNVLGINLHGEIVTYIPKEQSSDSSGDSSGGDMVASEDVMGYINAANDDKNIKAVVVEVDSGGGMPVAGEEIARAIQESKKPVIAFIRGAGDSAAYWAITPASKIFASANSDVGSIGVTASYSENISTDTKFIQLSTGKYKDSYNPDKPITEDEKKLMMRDLKIIEENFIDAVAKNRHMPLSEVRSLADGSTVLGEQAKSLGLIDEIGGFYDVDKYLQKQLGVQPTYCWE